MTTLIASGPGGILYQLAPQAIPPVAAGFKVDISRGERIGRVSSEWLSRPEDQRYLSLEAC